MFGRNIVDLTEAEWQLAKLWIRFDMAYIDDDDLLQEIPEPPLETLLENEDARKNTD